LSAFTLLLN